MERDGPEKIYRVHGYKLLSEFREAMKSMGLRPEHAGTFLYLITHGNEAKWPDWLNFDWNDAVQTLNVKKDTFYKYLGVLHNAGVITWDKGNREKKLGRIKIENLKKYRKEISFPKFGNDRGNDRGNSYITDKKLIDKESPPTWKDFWHKEVLPTYAPHEPNRHEKTGRFMPPIPSKTLAGAELEKWVDEWQGKLGPLNKRLAEINKTPKAHE